MWHKAEALHSLYSSVLCHLFIYIVVHLFIYIWTRADFDK